MVTKIVYIFAELLSMMEALVKLNEYYGAINQDEKVPTVEDHEKGLESALKHMWTTSHRMYPVAMFNRILKTAKAKWPLLSHIGLGKEYQKPREDDQAVPIAFVANGSSQRHHTSSLVQALTAEFNKKMKEQEKSENEGQPPAKKRRIQIELD